METLNALLKEVIPILDGITYTPQVIKTNNAKGELVVKIEMQKGAVRATVDFTIVGFTTTSQVQADLEAALAKIGADTISGDENKLPSSMTSTSIGILKGFPQTTINEVHFSVAPKTPIDAAGTLAITLTATKGSESQAKELTIRGFKKQNNEETIKEALTKIVTNTISGDDTKLPSQMTPSLIKALTGFPKTRSNDVSFSVAIKNGSVDDDKGQLVIILTATKGSNTKAQELTISGFQAQAQVNQIIVDNEIKRKFTISANSTRLPSQMTPTLIKALTGFPTTRSNDVSFSVAIKNGSVDDSKGQLVIILTTTKGDANKEKEIMINGFQTQAQVNQITVDNEIKRKFTISANSTRLPSQMTPTLIKALTGFPTTTNDVHFSVAIKNGSVDDDKGQLVIILTVTKGSEGQTKELTIRGFKISAQAQANQEDVDNELKKDFTISANSNKLPSQMTPTLIKALTGFPTTTTTNDVHFSVVIKRMVSFIGDAKGELEFTLIASKAKQSASKNIIISGFKSRELSQEEKAEKNVALVKKGLDLIGTVEINDDNIFADFIIFYHFSIDMTNIDSLTSMDWSSIEFPKGYNDVFNNKVTLKYSEIVNPQDDTIKIITVTISSKTSKATATSTIMISGFASRKQAQLDINAAQTLLDGFDAKIIDDTKTTTQVTYKDIKDFIAKTTKSPNALDQAIIKQVTIAIEVIPKGDTSQSVTFTISKDGGTSATSTIEISGFVSQKQWQQINAAKTIIDKFSANIIDDTKTTVQVTYEDIADFITKTTVDSLNAIDQAIIKQVTITHKTTSKGDTSQSVIFTISKDGGASVTSTIEISGFKSQTQASQETITSELSKITEVTITSNPNKLPSQMTPSLIKALVGFPEASNGVHFSVAIEEMNSFIGDAKGELEFTLIATKGKQSASKNIIISGFKSKELSQNEKDVVLVKKGLDLFGNGTINDDSLFANNFKFFNENSLYSGTRIYYLIKTITDKTSLVDISKLKNLSTGFWAVLNRVSTSKKLVKYIFTSIVDPQDNTAQIITITIELNDAIATTTIVISGFATQT